MTLKQLSLYGKTFQLKVIKALLFDRAFILNVRDVLKEEYFDSDAYKWIIKQIIQYFDTYHNTISKDILKVEYQKVGNEVLRVDIKEQIRLITSMSEDDMEYIQEEFTNFCKNQEMKAAILSSAELLEGGDFDGIRSRIERAMKAGVDKNLGHEYKKDIDLRYREDTRKPIPFHIPQLTHLTQGGVGGGDLVIIFGNPGGGKCVDYNTEIEIEYPEYSMTLKNSAGKEFEYIFKPWDEFNIDGEHIYGWQARMLVKTVSENRKQKRIKIGDLFSNLGIEPYPEQNYPVLFDLKVNTPYGYKPIEVLFTTQRQDTVTTYLSNGKRITTSEKHQVKKEEEWVMVGDLQEGDFIETKAGQSFVKKQVKKQANKVLYDLSVQDVHCYYGNDVLHHNSWACIGLAANAVKLGYNVNYYTLELSEDYVGKRFDCTLTGLSIDKIQSNRDFVEEVVRNLPGNLIVKEYPPKGASIETIRSHIMKCSDMGFPPDLVVIDYIDYLKSSSKGGYSERKDEVDDVYIGAKGLAKEFKIPVISPSQVNRMGAKDDVIEGDKAAGSYDKMMVADIAISMSRKKEDKVEGTGRIHVMKNRYGEDGRTFEAKIDTSNGFIEITGEHGEEMEEIYTKKGNEKAKQALDRLFNNG